MKFNTVFTFPHKGTLMKFREVLNSDTGAVASRDYFDAGQIKFKLIPGSAGGGRPVMYSTAKLNSFERIVLITDQRGDSILDETGYEVTTIVPVLNPFGDIDGYSYGLKRLTVTVSGA